MTNEQRMKNLNVPQGIVDAVLDTDAYNEVDDQFAFAYLLRSSERACVKAIYAAPFHNKRSDSPRDGMEKSYREIKKLLALAGEERDVYRGSPTYLPNEMTPVDSPAARDLVERAKRYSPENPLYIVAIGAITNIASAILLEPAVAENVVLVWLGGHAHHFADTKEFNMMQDVAAARVVFSSGVPLIQLPCRGVVSHFTISKPELEYWFAGKNPLSDYLAKNAIEEADSYAAGKPWTRIIWDVLAVAWLFNDNDRFMMSRILPTPELTYDHQYIHHKQETPMRYVYFIKRDVVLEDLIKKITA
ncbi:MAG: nucleoside hydrolase [Clostridia bacterium]|nr:nucleoside hydrolase [Clostridia bacterium]